MISPDAEFQQVVEFLYAQLPVFQRDGDPAFKKDLRNTLRLCAFLDHPQHRFGSVHVAGTNGKGSSSHYLAAVLQTAGYKTGLYTSPHLKSFTERIKINGREIEKQAVIDFVARVKPMIDEIRPSFFELTVAMAFDYFARRQVDVAVIEVGMGGRLDSTNVVLPEVSLITNISYDHRKYLGDTLPEIAAEKAGIIKPGIPVVISETQPEVVPVFNSKAAECRSAIYYAQDDYPIEENGGFHYRFGGEEWALDSRSLGSYQVRNLPGVLKTIELLTACGFDITARQVNKGLKNAFALTGLKGRWQQLTSSPLTFCDTGHNEEGIRLALQQVDRYRFDRLHFVIGMMQDKEADKLLALFPRDAFYYFCRPQVPRAMPSAELAALAAGVAGLHGLLFDSVAEAVAGARDKAKSDDFIFIGGSTFVVAEVL